MSEKTTDEEMLFEHDPHGRWPLQGDERFLQQSLPIDVGATGQR